MFCFLFVFFCNSNYVQYIKFSALPSILLFQSGAEDVYTHLMDTGKFNISSAIKPFPLTKQYLRLYSAHIEVNKTLS